MILLDLWFYERFLSSGECGRLFHPDGLFLLDTGDEEEPCHTTDSASCHEHDVLCLYPGDLVFLVVLSVYSVEKINLMLPIIVLP